MGKRKWYVVTVGRDVGVFETWLEVSPLVTGVSGALHQSFPTEEEAHEIFLLEQSRGHVKTVPPPARTQTSAPAQPNLPSRSPRETATPNVPRGHQTFSRSPAPPRRPPRLPALSQPSSTLNLLVTVKSEVNSPSLFPSSSPPTGVTQVISLSSSSSGALSPIALRENDFGLDPDESDQISSNDLSNFASPRPVTASVSVPARSNETGSFGSITINVTVPPMQCVHYGTGHSARGGHSAHGGRENLDNIPSQMTALSLDQGSHISRGADPRSPFTQQRLTSSRRPSPRMQGQEVPSMLFQL